MDKNHEELQEFDLDDILSEFHDLPDADILEDSNTPDLSLTQELAHLDELLQDHPVTEIPVPAEVPAEVSAPEVPAGEPADAAPAPEVPEEIPEPVPEEPESAQEPDLDPAVASMDTVRMNEIIREVSKELEEDSAVSEDATIRLDAMPPLELESKPQEPAETEEANEAPAEAAEEAPAEEPAEAAEEKEDKPEEEAPRRPIILDHRTRLRELKKKLVAGPEKRYYELTEIGLGRVQLAILVNLVIVALCAGVTTLSYLDMVPENRLRFVIFSQVLAMLVSALLGCHQMLDGIGDIFRGRFTINTMLSLTFAACCVDALFCLQELRIPCCAAFSLEMTMALWARYQRRSTEIGQMDTLRKAVQLKGIVRVADFFEGKDGLLRTEGEVEDFMDNYQKSSTPEKVQSVYAFLSLLLCIAIAVFAGLHHGISLAFQILSTSLLVAVPASFFIATTRPMSILEKRLHMVGTVLCGWKGVKGLCGKAAFPLTDEDLFPVGSTKLNGVKFYGDRDPDEIISFSTALINAAGGGLVPVFNQLLNSRSCRVYPVVNFQNYGSGGIGGEVCDEPVLLGSLNFLQDMGVEIPEGTMVSQAVYAAIDGQLCAVYAISYAKMRSAAAGMVTLCGYRKLTPVLTCGDFMLTESFIRGKFNIKTRRIAFPTRDVRTQLQQRQPDADAPVLALATRDELVSTAYAITGARSLRTATKLGVAIHLLGGILGMLIMAVLAYLGSTELLTPSHVLLYQLVWMIPGLLITEWTRNV